MLLHRSLLRRPLYLAVCYCAGVTGFVPLRHARGSVRSTTHDEWPRILPTPLAPTTTTSRVVGRLKAGKEGDGSHDNKVKVDASTLLGSVLRRAEYTMQVRDEILAAAQRGDDSPSDLSSRQVNAAVRDLLKGVGNKITESNSSSSTSTTSDGARSISPSSDNDDDDDDDLLNYGANPSITMTALAHSLWKSIIRPGKDSAIDATAGNGGDATALAELLFTTTKTSSRASASHLVCIDIQKDACEATQKKLSKILLQDTLYNNVSVYHESHAPLSLPPDGSGPVAVVAYNLGYLPGQERSEQSTITQTSTTLSSLTDAVLCLRLGGLLSVLTYPQTNSVEDAAVQAFVEGLALFSSQSHDWRDFLVAAEDTNHCYTALNAELCSEIRQRLQYIHEELGARQCWRVHVHEKLGWVKAPRLLTATRVR